MAGRVSRAGKPLLLATLFVVALIGVAAGLYLMLDLEQGTEHSVVTHIAIEEEAQTPPDEAGDTPITSAPTPPAPEPDAPKVPEPDTSEGATTTLPEPEIPDWQRFAAAAEAPDTRPRIAVVVTGLGLAADAIWRLICPYTGPAHAFGAHTSGILVAVVLGLLLAWWWESSRARAWRQRDA